MLRLQCCQILELYTQSLLTILFIIIFDELVTAHIKLNMYLI